MTATIHTDEMFLDLIRDTIVQAIDDSEFMMEHDNGCVHGCCAREFHYVNDCEATVFADKVITNILGSLDIKK